MNYSMDNMSIAPIKAQSPIPMPGIQSPIPQPVTGFEWASLIFPLTISVLTGVITGLVAPTIAPYVKWRLEKIRRRHERRLQLIETWYKLIEDDSYSADDLLNLPTFSSIERLLTQESKSKLKQLKRRKASKLIEYTIKNHEAGLSTVDSITRNIDIQIEEFAATLESANKTFGRINELQEEVQSLRKPVSQIAIDLFETIFSPLKHTEVLSDSGSSKLSKTKNSDTEPQKLLSADKIKKNLDEIKRNAEISSLEAIWKVEDNLMKDLLRKEISEIEAKWDLI